MKQQNPTSIDIATIDSIAASTSGKWTLPDWPLSGHLRAETDGLTVCLNFLIQAHPHSTFRHHPTYLTVLRSLALYYSH